MNTTHSQVTLGDVFREGFREYMHNNNTIPFEHYKAASAIINCRTSVLGGRLYKCEECGHSVPLFNSCRNRHCPQCQAISRAKWVEKRNNELLPVPYYHIVFTIPEQLKPFALRNKQTFYNILFKAASQTLIDLGANPSFLGGNIGLIAILHTWNQQLLDHPHVHCVVPAGAISDDGVEWLRARKDIFFHRCD
jgi:Putative transposase.